MLSKSLLKTQQKHRDPFHIANMLLLLFTFLHVLQTNNALILVQTFRHTKVKDYLKHIGIFRNQSSW